MLGVTGRGVPDLVVRLAALFEPEFRSVAGELGHVKRISDAKARRVLGWRPRLAEEAIRAAAAQGAVPLRNKAAPESTGSPLPG